MTTEHHAFEPPDRDESGDSSPSNAGAAPPAGRYRLEAADAAAAVRARQSRGGQVLGWILGAGLIAGLIAEAAAGSFSSMPVTLVLAAIALGSPLLGPWLAGRAVERMTSEQRELRISLDEASVTVTDDFGNSTRFVWQSFAGRREAEDRVFLELPSKLAYVLPRRAWPAHGEYEIVRDRVAEHVPLAKRSVGFLPTAMLLWILLLLMCVVIWNFFSDVPRTPPHEAPSSSES